MSFGHGGEGPGPGPGDLGRLRDENALLRAALSDARGRITEMEQGSDRDPLTNLLNARQFLGQLDRFVSIAARHHVPAALLTIDLCGPNSHFADLGQVERDSALIHVARTLEGLVRASDVVARTQETIFSLLLDRLDGDSAIETGDRIARFIADHPVDLGPARVSIAVNVAVATILPGDSVEDIVQRSERNRQRLTEF